MSTSKYGACLKRPRHARPDVLLFFSFLSLFWLLSISSTGCGSSSEGDSGAAGSGGTTGAAGTGNAGSGSAGTSGVSTAGTSGTAGMVGDGGVAGTGAAGTGAFACPTPPSPGTCAPPADIRCPYPKISQTGCLAADPFGDPKIPVKMASNVVPYEVNSPLWSDGALKTRGMRLPAGGKIHVKDCTANPKECEVLDPNTLKCCAPPADDGKWVFPVATVLVKNFMFADTSRPSGYKVVETRLFVHLDKAQDLEGVKTEWVGYGYRWDDAQTEATLIGKMGTASADGSDVGVSAMFNVTPTKGGAAQSIKWDYPSRVECMTCHTGITPSTMPVGGYTLGPETVQMNRIAEGDTMNQIDRIAAMGLFETPPAKPYKAALVVPYPGQAGSPPVGASLEQRARSYLHANCGFCHRPDGVWSGFDIRYDVPFKTTSICNGVPGKGDLGVSGALLLAPKSPTTSLMVLRMKAPKGSATAGGTGRMPAIGSSVVDTLGTELISQWITSINACPQ